MNLNGMFRMIQKQKSQAITDRLTRIRESIYNSAPKNHIVQEANSQKFIGPTKDQEEF